MNAKTRNIILGSILLVSLLVIFVPMMFDRSVVIDTEISEVGAPQVEEVSENSIEIPEPTPPDLELQLEEVRAEMETLVNDQGLSPDTDTNIGEPKLTPEREDTSAWAVQLASYQSEEAANNLIALMKEQGSDAWISMAHVNEMDVHRVAVGPFTRREEAVKFQKSLGEALELEPMIVAIEY